MIQNANFTLGFRYFLDISNSTITFTYYGDNGEAIMGELHCIAQGQVY